MNQEGARKACLQKIVELLVSSSVSVDAVREALVDCYNLDTGSSLNSNGLMPDEEVAVQRWLSMIGGIGDLLPHMLRDRLVRVPHVSLSPKNRVSYLAQLQCPLCGGSFPVSIRPLRIRPASRQALKGRRGWVQAYKTAIADYLRDFRQPQLIEGPVCVQLIFLLQKQNVKRIWTIWQSWCWTPSMVSFTPTIGR